MEQRENLNTKHSQPIAFIALLCAVLIWSSSFIATKYALGSMQPMAIMLGRMIFASIGFAFFYKFYRGLVFSKKDIFLLLLLALLEPCLYFLFEVKALVYTSASQAGVITATMPLLTAILAGLILKEQISKQVIIGSIIAFLGAGWLSFGSDAQEYAPNPLLGNTLEFLAMVCAAGYTIIIRHLIKRFNPIFLTSLQGFAGALFFLPLAFIESDFSLPHVSVEGLFAMAYLGLFVTLGGYGLYNFALSRLLASRASAFVNLIPAFTLILAFIILDERLNMTQILATFLIFFGVLTTQISFRKK